MKAVILAAGKGTRLSPLTDIFPKPLVPIGITNKGKYITIIERIIIELVKAGINEVIIIINYKGNTIKRYLLDGSKYNCRIKYLIQEKLDGNAGAFYVAQDLIGNNDVLITDCDNFFQDNTFNRIINYHNSKKPDITVGVSKVDNVQKFAIIKVDDDNNPIDIYEKPKSSIEWGNLAKSGLMILSNKVAKLNKNISKTKDNEFTTTNLVKHCIKNDYFVSLFNLKNFNDIGTWDEYKKVVNWVK